MRRLDLAPLLAVLLAVACSGSGGPSRPPPTSAPAPADDPEAGAGFASIPDPEPARAQHSTDCPPELAEKIRRTFGERCRFERACGEHIGVDCDAAVDGPYYYVRRDSLEVVSRCGGACMTGTCTDCPPKAWTCATY